MVVEEATIVEEVLEEDQEDLVTEVETKDKIMSHLTTRIVEK